MVEAMLWWNTLRRTQHLLVSQFWLFVLAHIHLLAKLAQNIKLRCQYMQTFIRTPLLRKFHRNTLLYYDLNLSKECNLHWKNYPSIKIALFIPNYYSAIMKLIIFPTHTYICNLNVLYVTLCIIFAVVAYTVSKIMSQISENIA